MEKCSVCLKEEKYCTCVNAHKKYPKHNASLQSAMEPRLVKVIPEVPDSVRATVDPVIKEGMDIVKKFDSGEMSEPLPVEALKKSKEKKKKFWDKRH